MNLQATGMIKTAVPALIFGLFYGMALSFTPLQLFFRPRDCWDSQDDFWGSPNQAALIVSAILSFFVLEFFKGRGWNTFFKKILVFYLCFQIFALVSGYDTIYRQHCFFPLTMDEFLMSQWRQLLFVATLSSFAAMLICARLRSVYKGFLKFLFSERNSV